jgi:Putative beta-barrel porin-2, OmpL-like. bbp2
MIRGNRGLSISAFGFAFGASMLMASGVLAQTPSPASPSPGSNAWINGINLGAQIEGGVTGNFDHPSDGLNFGRLFDDKANTALLNQIQLTATRPINSSAPDYDLGFTLQATYGSDVRYLHYLGEFNHLTSDRYQLTLLQANVLLHAPWLFSGGVDFKLGQFVTPIGYETIDPSTNPFYSHSYIFNFGPFQHTGLLAVAHVSPMVDLYGQVDTGESTTFDGGDNNAEPAGLFGIGLNGLAGGKLNLLLLTHLGPENSTLALGDAANNAMRYESDLVATYKATDKLSFAGEVQFQHDEAFGADAYGAAAYVSYALTPTLTVNGRAEIYRDNTGFFVAAFPGNLDSIRALGGLPNTSFSAGRQTFSEFTAGATYKPNIPVLKALMVRPEIRWDKSFSGGHPYNGGHNTGSFTLASDVILGF